MVTHHLSLRMEIEMKIEKDKWYMTRKFRCPVRIVETNLENSCPVLGIVSIRNVDYPILFYNNGKCENASYDLVEYDSSVPYTKLSPGDRFRFIWDEEHASYDFPYIAVREDGNDKVTKWIDNDGTLFSFVDNDRVFIEGV